MNFEFFNKIVREFKVSSQFAYDLKFRLQYLLRSVFRYPHESHFNFLKYLLLPCDDNDYIFVDIGANRGQTIQSVKLMRGFKIIAFEPLPFLCKKISTRYQSSSEVEINNFAIGDKSAEVLTLYTPKYNQVHFDGLSSLSAKEALYFFDKIKKPFFSFKRSNLQLDKFSVNVRTLDSFNIAPLVIKADVQGHEMSVLRGASNTIKQHKPIIFLERPSIDLEVNYLLSYNYKPYVFDGYHLREGYNAYNVIFLHDSHFRMVSKDLIL